MRPVIFDLDGTLTASGPVIVTCLTETARAHGYTVTNPGRFIGPPLWQTFEDITGAPPERIAELVTDYRRRYAVELVNTPLYGGIIDLLDDLAAAGAPLAIATSKRQSVARDVIAHLGLTDRFVAICGAPDDESPATKADSIACALATLRAAGADVASAVMVGDRIHDVDGAAAHSLPAIVVTWGYGLPGEAEMAWRTAATPAQLATLLLEREAHV